MPQHLNRLVDVACGRKAADCYLENCRILNVYTGELLSGHGVAVTSGRIAYVGKLRSMVAAETEIIDARGGVLVPGYVDPHAHFDNILSLRSIAATIVPLGTTAIVNDTLAIVARFGAAGIAYLKEISRGLPLRHYLTVPVSGWSPELEEMGYDTGRRLSDADLAELLADGMVLGTSEFVPWRRLLSGEDRYLEPISKARSLAKRCEGHSPGAKPDDIQALAAAGITDCHEALTAEDALERLRAGLYVILRHGPARFDLPALASVVLKEGVDRSRLMFTPDWVPPNDLVRYGHLDQILETALKLGIPPVDVYRMVTVNPARYFGMEEQWGAIAPGRYADILCLDELTRPQPRWVMSSGRVVAQDGAMLPSVLPEGAGPQLPSYRPPVRRAQPSDFGILAAGRAEVVAPAIEIVDRTVTKRVDLTLPVRNGVVVHDGAADPVMKLAMPNAEGKFSLAYLVGVGAPLGAISSSMASEPYHTLIAGSSDQDMALAYNRMLELGGGIVAAHQGAVRWEMPLPAGGYMSHASVSEVGDDIDGLNQWARDHGSPLENIFLTHHFLTYVGVPFFRMTPWGIFDVRKHAFLPVILDFAV